MVGPMPQQLRGQGRQHRTARAIVAAECRLRRIDDLSSLALRPGTGAQRHSVHVRHEEQPIRICSCTAARQIDDEVARLSGQGNARVSVIEADGARRNAGVLERGDQLLANHRFSSGHAFHGKEAHETPYSSFCVDGRHGPVLLALAL